MINSVKPIVSVSEAENHFLFCLLGSPLSAANPDLWDKSPPGFFLSSACLARTPVARISQTMNSNQNRAGKTGLVFGELTLIRQMFFVSAHLTTEVQRFNSVPSFRVPTV